MKIDANDYDRIARDVFFPVYPLIADQIIAYTAVTRGLCLDIGCGGGYLGAALAERSDLVIRFFDHSPEMLSIVRRTIDQRGLHARADILQGDITAIALPEGSIDLAVSRGSIFFWEDLPGAFSEIYRVLAPDGWAYIGGGFGSRDLRETIEREMASRNQGDEKFQNQVRRNLGPVSRARFEAALTKAGIGKWTILQDEEIGLWIIMRKSI